MISRLLIAPASVLALAACSGPACLQEQAYKDAEPFPKLEAPAGLSVPSPDPNYAIPEVADGPVGAFSAEAAPAESEPRARCLEMPPRFEAAQG